MCSPGNKPACTPSQSQCIGNGYSDLSHSLHQSGMLWLQQVFVSVKIQQALPVFFTIASRYVGSYVSQMLEIFCKPRACTIPANDLLYLENFFRKQGHGQIYLWGCTGNLCQMLPLSCIHSLFSVWKRKKNERGLHPCIDYFGLIEPCGV